MISTIFAMFCGLPEPPEYPMMTLLFIYCVKKN